jgi:uncharacterized membrane protein
MHLLDVVTILCTGMMTGNELAVSFFVNPVVWQLEEPAQAMALRLFARVGGRVMPFWYALGLILLIAETWLRWHEPSRIWLLAAVAIWGVSIVYTLLTLLPINNRIAGDKMAGLKAAELPAGWRQEHKKWDKLHQSRIAMLVVAVACFSYGILGAC